MRLLRWILGFPLAAAIAFGVVTMGAFAYDRLFLNSQFSNRWTDEIIITAIMMIGCALWVFLTCLFIPSSKKIAGIIVVILMAGVVIWGTVADWRGGNLEKVENLFPDIGMVVSLFFAYAGSYIIFKDNGWRRLKTSRPQKDLADIYGEQVAGGALNN